MSDLSERARLSFVAKRDGIDAALKFAEQTKAAYTEAALRSSPYWSSIKYCDDVLNGKEKIKVDDDQ